MILSVNCERKRDGIQYEITLEYREGVAAVKFMDMPTSDLMDYLRECSLAQAAAADMVIKISTELAERVTSDNVIAFGRK